MGVGGFPVSWALLTNEASLSIFRVSDAELDPSIAGWAQLESSMTTFVPFQPRLAIYPFSSLGPYVAACVGWGLISFPDFENSAPGGGTVYGIELGYDLPLGSTTSLEVALSYRRLSFGEVFIGDEHPELMVADHFRFGVAMPLVFGG